MRSVLSEERKSLRGWGKTTTFVKLVTAGGRYSLPLESDTQFEVAPGDQFSTTLDVIRKVYHVTGREARCSFLIVTLSWSPPPPTEY